MLACLLELVIDIAAAAPTTSKSGKQASREAIAAAK